MSNKTVWINLAANSPEALKHFYSELPGFKINEERSNESMLVLTAGSKDLVICFFKPEMFSNFIKSSPADLESTNEVLLSLGADSRGEVDDLAKRVQGLGGQIFAEPAEIDDWMYSFGFSDPEGHKWNVLYMDESNAL